LVGPSERYEKEASDTKKKRSKRHEEEGNKEVYLHSDEGCRCMKSKSEKESERE